MVLAWVWRVNPVEGSVMPDFLTSNPFGLALTFVLLGTCMPVLIVAVVFSSVVGLPESDALPPAIILQRIVFLLLGRVLSVMMAHFRGRA